MGRLLCLLADYVLVGQRYRRFTAAHPLQDGTMKYFRTFLVACALTTGLTSCGDSAGAPLAPEGPRLNGFTFGSGHRTADSTSTSTATAGATAHGGAER